MAEIVKVSSKYQIAIPRGLRRALDIHPGDQLLPDLEGSGEVRLRVRPGSYTEALRGLHSEVWRDTDAVEYVRQERNPWQKA